MEGHDLVTNQCACVSAVCAHASAMAGVEAKLKSKKRLLAAKNELVKRLSCAITESADEIFSKTLSQLSDSPSPLGKRGLIAVCKINYRIFRVRMRVWNEERHEITRTHGRLARETHKINYLYIRP